MKTKLVEIESSLRDISAAHQAERKRLASAHSSLSQQQSQSSQTGTVVIGESSESLRRQLTSLANRQKTLLQCFKTQRDVAEKLEELSQRLREEGEILHCSSEPERVTGDSIQRRGPTAAIPNLLQHLRPPIDLSNSIPISAVPQLRPLPQQVSQHPTSRVLATVVPTMGGHTRLPLTSTTTTTGETFSFFPDPYPTEVWAIGIGQKKPAVLESQTGQQQTDSGNGQSITSAIPQPPNIHSQPPPLQQAQVCLCMSITQYYCWTD